MLPLNADTAADISQRRKEKFPRSKYCRSVEGSLTSTPMSSLNIHATLLQWSIENLRSYNTDSLMELSPSWETANCTAFYGTRSFISVFTRALYWSLS